jgi:large subunit ribosomal protein L6
MSRVGKQIIEIPQGVTITVNGLDLKVKGPKGELGMVIPEFINISQENNGAKVSVKDDTEKEQRALWGTWSSHLKNMVDGVTEGFQKELEVNGVGYKVALQGKKIVLNIGYSHTIEYDIPEGIDAEVDKNIIRIKGINKQLVGQVAAEIRQKRKVEPYKGKGIKYIDEQVKRKAGKAAKGAE